jgi:starch synthase (maltosyl-transferring)
VREPCGFPGKEEYLDSEKYEIRRWDLERPESLREFIALVNRIRRESPPLQQDGNSSSTRWSTTS